MRHARHWLLLAVAFLGLSASAQSQGPPGVIRCGTTEHMAELLANDKDYAARLAEIDAQAQVYAAQPFQPDVAVTIPVVVHVVYNTAAQNIPDAQVQSQIQVLNEDFRRLNADAVQTQAAFQPLAADTQINFCLATRDPTGAPSSGITRTQTSTTSFSSNDAIKHAAQGGHDAWPAAQYLNIWVANLSGGLLGYAQFPGGPAATDGVVILYSAFGRPSSLAAYNLGRTTTHEVGHWLNLIHIWGDSSTCGVDDQVADTPDSSAAHFGCPLSVVECGQVAMVQNYMDYTDDSCMNLFTQGQKARMQALFGAGGNRVSILGSTACGPVTPQYQVNSARASLDIDGVQGTSLTPAVRVNCVGSSGAVHMTSVPTNVGHPFDIALGVGALVPQSGGAFVSPHGQIANVPLAGVVFISTGTGASAPIPWPGSLTIPYTASVPLTVSLQGFILDASFADGIGFTQGSQLNAVVGGSFPAGPTGDDASAAIALGGTTCIPSVTFYGVTYTAIQVNTNGRVTFGAGSTDYSPTVAEALAGSPFAGFWTDLNVTGAAAINITSPAANRLRVAYAAVPYFGTTVTNTYAVEFDVVANTVTLDGLLGIPANTAASGASTRQFLGLSRGSGATDSGTTTFSVGGSGAPANATRMWYDFYNNTGGGQCASLAGALNRIVFTPFAGGNYSWVGF